MVSFTHYFVNKILSKRGFQEISINHSSDIGFKDFMKLYKKLIAEPNSVSNNYTTLPALNPLHLHFR